MYLQTIRYVQNTISFDSSFSLLNVLALNNMYNKGSIMYPHNECSFPLNTVQQRGKQKNTSQSSSDKQKALL